MAKRHARNFASDQEILNTLMYDLKGRWVAPLTVLGFLKDNYPEDNTKRIRTRLRALTSPGNQLCRMHNVAMERKKRGRELFYKVLDKN